MHRTNHRIWRLIVALMLTLLLLSAFWSVQAQGGTLRVGVVAPQVLDPALGSNDSEVLFNRSIYDYLIEVLPDKSLAPNLATAWTISEDGLTYTFTLRDAVTFHDGSSFSSADVVFTFNRLKEIQSPALNLLGEFEVSAPDASTVVFTIPAPNADFLYGVADRFALILKDGTSAPNELTEGSAAFANFNGTGPFMLSEYREGERAVLTRNPNYWKVGQPLLDSVEFVFINDPVTQVNAIRSGEVDFIFKISPDLFSTLEGETTVTMLQKATNQHPVIRLRTDVGPGQDVRVRQAFKYATDREQLNDLVLEGRGVIGNNDPIGPSFGVFFDSSIQNPDYDPAKACELLAEAGYPDGLQMTLQTINVLGYDQLATVLREQWEPACIKVEIQVNEEGFYYSDDNPDNWLKAELGITGWGDRPVPQGYLAQAYASSGIYNETHWSDPELDALIQQASVTTDTEARVAVYHQIAAIFNERGPIIIPWFAPVFGAVRRNVEGLDMAPFPGLTDLRSVSVVG
ncbi:MAG: ABC transporter substrate-binding protein [Anaerolineae bacterium]|nr:ABC transporter substrate-binding protein [Anaerolineae bacterium]